MDKGEIIICHKNAVEVIVEHASMHRKEKMEEMGKIVERKSIEEVKKMSEEFFTNFPGIGHKYGEKMKKAFPTISELGRVDEIKLEEHFSSTVSEYISLFLEEDLELN